ncbi:hypothetical protein J1N35_039841 [Gossypium stocksii]|uniref:Retrotransposon gag domain-containing protein n=1 Tax=Gossypium stocksii TaxID=47602 RepID=A0A9D3ZI03_9ROSI|nr:hypothetical protein J1N35_039841 [Gossypium stocksii]
MSPRRGMSLSRGSICAFDQLANMSMSQFLANKNLQQSWAYLMSIHQKEGKSFYDFVKRFNAATIITKGDSNDLAI